jgi:hypothetical protein
LVFRHRQPHAGVIYLRLPTFELAEITSRLSNALQRYPDRLGDFLVVTAHRVRVRGA